MKQILASDKHRSWLIVAVALLTTAASPQVPLKSAGATSVTRPDERDESRTVRLQWWSEARFGMFIHWGLYAQDGCFWKGRDGSTEHMMRHLNIPFADYQKIAAEFNPTQFNADEWVRLAKDAGMRYMVITAKHHDGFAMYASQSSGYNIVARTPFKRDPLKELAEACRRQGLRFGVYYSLGRDWQDPDVPTVGARRSNTWDYPDEASKDLAKYFARKVKPQVTELLTQFQPLSVLWFDTPELTTPAQSEELIRLVQQLQPGCIVNSRVGNKLGDYAVAEQEIRSSGTSQPWETCMTLNNHWGYHKLDEKWKSAQTLVRHLIDIASKGGNFLLNVGPTGAGVIPEPSVGRLREMGRWLQVNGEAIYGTEPGQLKRLAWGRCTQKTTAGGVALYLHVFDWPADGKLLVPGLKSPVETATLLANGQRLKVAAEANGLTVALPPQTPDPVSATVVLKVRGALEVE